MKDPREKKGPARVLVELTVRSPEAEHLRHLEEIGLTVERVILNTIVGTIADEEIPALESDDLVAAVERETKLDLH